MVKNRAWLIAAGIIIAFFLAYKFVPYEHLKRWLDAGRVGIWATVWAISLHLAVTSFLAPRRDAGQVVAIALNIAALVILTQAIWIPAKRELTDFLDVWFKNLVDCVVVLGFIISGVSFLMPIGNTIGVTPPRNWWFLLGAFTIGGIFGGIMIGLGIQVSAG